MTIRGWLFILLLAVTTRVAAQVPQANDSTAHDSVRALATVTVNGKRVHVPPEFKEPYERAMRGRGFYITAEDVEAQNPKDVTSLLLRVPAVLISDRSVTFQRCQQGLQSAKGGGETSRVQVYLDGHRATANQSPNDVFDLLQSIPPQSVQLIEVYSGTSRIPAEFLNDSCAVIVIWTKAY